MGFRFQKSFLEADGELLSRILKNPSLAAAVAWAVCHVQAGQFDGFPDPAKDPEAAELEFLDGLDGDALQRLQTALWEALEDFFPRLRTVLSEARKHQQRLDRLIEEKSREAMGHLDRTYQVMQERFDRTIRWEIQQVIQEAEEQIEQESEPLGAG